MARQRRRPRLCDSEVARHATTLAVSNAISTTGNEACSETETLDPYPRQAKGVIKVSVR
jgi:hypothetical protein